MVDGKVVVTFDQPLREGEQATFEVAGGDRKFINVKAVARGNQVSLESPVSNPTKGTLCMERQSRPSPPDFREGASLSTL